MISALDRHRAFWHAGPVDRPLTGVFMQDYMVRDVYRVAQEGELQTSPVPRDRYPRDVGFGRPTLPEQPRDPQQLRTDILSMRAEMAQHKRPAGRPKNCYI